MRLHILLDSRTATLPEYEDTKNTFLNARRPCAIRKPCARAKTTEVKEYLSVRKQLKRLKPNLHSFALWGKGLDERSVFCKAADKIPPLGARTFPCSQGADTN